MVARLVQYTATKWSPKYSCFLFWFQLWLSIKYRKDMCPVEFFNLAGASISIFIELKQAPLTTPTLWYYTRWRHCFLLIRGWEGTEESKWDDGIKSTSSKKSLHHQLQRIPEGSRHYKTEVVEWQRFRVAVHHNLEKNLAALMNKRF